MGAQWRRDHEEEAADWGPISMVSENAIVEVLVATVATAVFLLGLAIPTYWCDRTLLRRARKRRVKLLLASTHRSPAATQLPQKEGDSSTAVDSGQLEPSCEEPSTVEQQSPSWKGVSLWELISQWNVEGERETQLSRNAQVYLSFQKHLLVAVGVMTLLCLAVLLPVNMTAPVSESVLNSNANPTSSYINNTSTDFDRTTLRFSQVSEARMSAHLVVLVAISTLVVYLFVHFQHHTIAEEVRFKNAFRNQVARRSILLEKLPRKLVEVVRTELEREALRVYGRDHVQHVEVIPRLQEYIDAREELEYVRDQCEHFQVVQRKRTEEGKTPSDPCTLICVCRCKRAVAHYSALVKLHKRLCDHEKRLLQEKKVKCSSRAIITFDSVSAAEEALKKRVHSDFKYLRQASRSRAPSGDDIEWRNVHVGFFHSWFLKLLWRSTFLLFAVFYASPVALVTSISPMANAKMWHVIEEVVEWSPWLRGLLTAYLPTLVLLIINSTLGPLIAYLVRLERPLTHTEQLRSILVRQSVYLVLGTVILPSLALSTVDAFLIKSQTENVSLRELFKNIFLPGSGAFFVNYMLQSIFVSLTLAMTSLVDRMFRWYSLSHAESDKEISQSAGPLEFRTIGNYSSLINTFTLILVYSCYVPIIAPLGLVFLLLKHWTDKYQIMNRIVKPTNPMLHTPRSIKRLSQLLFGSVLFMQFTWIVFFSAKVYTPHLVIAIILMSLTGLFVVWWSMYVYPKHLDKSMTVSRTTPSSTSSPTTPSVGGNECLAPLLEVPHCSRHSSTHVQEHPVQQEFQHPDFRGAGGGGDAVVVSIP